MWHGGQGHGWMIHFHAVPDSGHGIGILTNSQRSWPLMAEVLNDSARPGGFGSVKMSRIPYGIATLRVLIGLVLLATLWQVYRLVHGVRTGARQWAPLSRTHRMRRLLQATAATALLAALAWSAAPPYLTVSSVFPGVAGHVGIALTLLAIVVLLSASFPLASPEPHVPPPGASAVRGGPPSLPHPFTPRQPAPSPVARGSEQAGRPPSTTSSSSTPSTPISQGTASTH